MLKTVRAAVEEMVTDVGGDGGGRGSVRLEWDSRGDGMRAVRGRLVH